MRSALWSSLIALAMLADCSVSWARAPIRIAVIDSGLSLDDPRFSNSLCKDGHQDFTGEGISDHNGHGTSVAGLIQRYAGGQGYCLVILKYYSARARGSLNLSREVAAIRWAVKLGVDIVNLSGGGGEFSEDEYLAIRDAKRTTFVLAAGNLGADIGERETAFYPASYGLPNTRVVGNLGRDLKPVAGSNYGSVLTDWVPGEGVEVLLPHFGEGHASGTSMSTAILTGMIVRRLTQPRELRSR